MNTRIIAIGDIHGCCKTFNKLLFDNLGIERTDEIFCLGDYIDRGFDSKGVVDLILKLRSDGFRIHTLRGNHEQLMMDSLLDTEIFQNWVLLGGNRTLKSFGVENYAELQPSYRAFFESTQLYIEHENFIFVHAGLNFNRVNIFEDQEAMLWIRSMNINPQKLAGRILIHGHHPKPVSEIIKQEIAGEINIDGGCVYKHSKTLGSLVALNLTEGKFLVERNCEDPGA